MFRIASGSRLPLSIAAAVSALTLVAAPAVANPAQTAASLDVDRLTGPTWRADNAALFARLPELRRSLTLRGPLRGTIVAGTLRLPDTVELSGDTTILARRIVFAGRSPRIACHGCHLRLLPIESIRTGAGLDGGTVTIDVTGTTGETGLEGGYGWDGYHGNQGDDGELWGVGGGWCFTTDAERGGDGEDGGTGGTGQKGHEAGAGGIIAFPIGADDPNDYRLIATGGTGGVGGTGGPGGNGGDGGDGGDGANVGGLCYDAMPGGNAGDGGDGGDAGAGGTGGEGGHGGDGGTIDVCYEAGWPGMIESDASGGAGGDGGLAGFPGLVPGVGGLGGEGGTGGHTGPDGRDGRDGWDGSVQLGSDGGGGVGGMPGTVMIREC